jgi:hypothetical protein
VTEDGEGESNEAHIYLSIAVGLLLGALIGLAVRYLPSGLDPPPAKVAPITSSWRVAGELGLLASVVIGVAFYIYIADD